MLHLAALLVIIALGAAVRLWARRHGEFIGQDTWDYLVEARAIRDNGMRLPESIPPYAVKSPYDIPPLFFLILARLPQKNIEQWSKYVSVLFDCANTLAISGFVWLVFGNADAAVLAAAMFAITPASAVETLTFNARPFASLLFTLFAASLALFSQQHSLFWLAAASLLSSLIFLTHRMTLQAAVVACAGASLAFMDASFLVPIPAGFFLAVLLSGGYYLRVFRNHVAITSFWRRHIAERRRGSSLSFLGQSLSKMLFNPWMLFVLLFIPASPAESLLWAVSLSLFAAALVTALRPFGFLGENHRYLEYSALSSFALASLYITRNPSAIVVAAAAACVLVSLGVLAAYQKKLLSIPSNVQPPDFMDAVKAIGRSKRDVVLSVPDYSAPITFFTRKRVVCASSPTVWEKHQFLVFRERTDIPAVAKEFRAGLVLVSPEFDRKEFRKKWRAIFRNRSFVLYGTGA
ncbi:MAG: hypothetical protein V1881_03720 [Candidatus Micrarchaeota archaeon]